MGSNKSSDKGALVTWVIFPKQVFQMRVVQILRICFTDLRNAFHTVRWLLPQQFRLMRHCPDTAFGPYCSTGLGYTPVPQGFHFTLSLITTTRISCIFTDIMYALNFLSMQHTTANQKPFSSLRRNTTTTNNNNNKRTSMLAKDLPLEYPGIDVWSWALANYEHK